MHELDIEGLQELGLVLRETEILLRSVYSPFKIIFSKLGFSAGFACHFHVVPVTNALLTEIAAHQSYGDEPDGNDTMLFLNRIYCERELSPQEQNDMMVTVSLLRLAANNQAQRTVKKLRFLTSADL